MSDQKHANTSPRKRTGKEALIQAGLDLMSEHGAERLSLRQCAARAGMSHAAPSHHFGGLAGLKQAVVAEGFRQFKTCLQDALKDAGNDPLVRLKTICRTYIRFALARPALFKEMFALNLHDIQPGRVDAHIVDAWEVFHTHCAPFERPGLPIEVIETQVRSFLQGYTRIALTGQFGPPSDDGLPEGPLEEVMAMLDHLQPTPDCPPGPVRA
ncbi:TetR/AcrR family transcriptional regulator [Aliiroseovarius crassostreae]|uniref:TetR/AcrR family transcriptional regulator n=1 Tax=Aliiroseovarius crassostreae TaxID=154981 RepID=UPI003C7BE63C